MKYDKELGKQLIDELLDLWSECQSRCDKIEKMIVQIKESQKKRL